MYAALAEVFEPLYPTPPADTPLPPWYARFERLSRVRSGHSELIVPSPSASLSGEYPGLEALRLADYSGLAQILVDDFDRSLTELPPVPPIEAAPRMAGLIAVTLSEDLRRDLLRLIGGIRSALRLALLRYRAALTRRPDRRSLLLVLLAVSRHFGRRGEPDDYALPARMPMPVIRGELVLAC